MKLQAFVLLLVAACATDDTTAAVESAAVVQNGQNLNGQNLNGQNLNGQNLNGTDAGSFMIWTSLQNVKLDGKTLAQVQLAKTKFTSADGVVSGEGFAQAELAAMRGDGRAVRIRLRTIVPPTAGASTWRYYVEYREDDQLWYPVCEDAAGATPAIPVNGIWDHRQGVPGGGAFIAATDKFTFACEGQGAIAKCLAMGYAPWELGTHHQACVRLIRGDYCGDGSAYTQNGNRVNVYDALGIQDDTEDWVIEAEWDENGARCFYPLNRSRAGIPCYSPRTSLACGSPTNFAAGALLMNETPSAGLTP